MKPVHLIPAAVVLLALAAIGVVAQVDHPAASVNPAATAIRQAAVTISIRLGEIRSVTTPPTNINAALGTASTIRTVPNTKPEPLNKSTSHDKPTK